MKESETTYIVAPPHTSCLLNEQGRAKESKFGVNGFGGLLILALFGMTEGFAFQRCRIWVPESFFDQFVMTKFLLMKVFMGAVSASCFFQSIMYYTNRTEFEKSRTRSRARRGYLITSTGLLMLGVGMALAGTGPTMLPAQIGSGVVPGLYAFAGALAGAIIFGIVDMRLHLAPRPSEASECVLDGKVNSIFGWNLTYPMISVPMGLLCLGIGFTLEFLFPYAAETAMNGLQSGIPPLAAGFVVGANQIPIRFIAKNGQGGSTAISNIASTMTFGMVPSMKNGVINTVGRSHQVAFVWVGSLMGAFISAMAFSEFHSLSDNDPKWWRAFIGGMVMQFGSKVAGGCTCGHGVTGVSELAMESMLGAACIFGGAIATGFILKAVA